MKVYLFTECTYALKINGIRYCIISKYVCTRVGGYIGYGLFAPGQSGIFIPEARKAKLPGPWHFCSLQYSTIQSRHFYCATRGVFRSQAAYKQPTSTPFHRKCYFPSARTDIQCNHRLFSIRATLQCHIVAIASFFSIVASFSNDTVAFISFSLS